MDDVTLPGMTYMSVLRSPHAHARIRGIDTSAAGALDGVLYVTTGEEARTDLGPIPEAWNSSETGAKGVDWYPLALEHSGSIGTRCAWIEGRPGDQIFPRSSLIARTR